MTYEIDVSLQCPLWESVLPDVEHLTGTVIERVLKTALPDHEDIEISIVLADDAFIQNLNKTYRHKDKPTNVLSFPMTEPEDIEQNDFLSLGDIIIAYETIVSEAEEQKKTVSDHFTHMLVHGCLHLLHYDHETDSEAITMETLEIKLLKSIGIKNPYETL